MSDRIITLQLPFKDTDNEQDFMDTVYDYFNGFDIEYEIKDGFCKVCLTRSNFLYCEDFEPLFGSVGISSYNANSYLKCGERSSLFLSDAWFYYIYASVIDKRYDNESNIVIIHIDDHRDMMDPFIGYKCNNFYNLLDGNKVDIQNKDDVKELINCGAITIGSMMTPLFFMKDKITVIHLTNICEEKTKYSLKEKIYTDNILGIDIGRIHLERKPIDLEWKKYYSVTDPDDIVDLVNKTDFVLLHYDMDYFNNRFNGSNDWQYGEGHHNPCLAEQKRKMDEINKALSTLVKKVKIVHTGIGLSPSFYPTEYWKSGLEYLLTSLLSIGIDTREIRDALKKEGWF